MLGLVQQSTDEPAEVPDVLSPPPASPPRWGSVAGADADRLVLQGWTRPLAPAEVSQTREETCESTQSAVLFLSVQLFYAPVPLRRDVTQRLKGTGCDKGVAVANSRSLERRGVPSARRGCGPWSSSASRVPAACGRRAQPPIGRAFPHRLCSATSQRRDPPGRRSGEHSMPAAPLSGSVTWLPIPAAPRRASSARCHPDGGGRWP